MPFYHSIRQMSDANKARTLSGLKRLRQQLDTEMPFKTRRSRLIVGTWNIRNFDDNRFGNGYRTEEDFLYIAEICSRFDVLAVQELCNDLAPLERVMRLLGPDYDYIVTDVTEGRSGNGERLGFIFDKHKVRFTGIAGELVLPDALQIKQDGKARQFARSPFLVSFQSGWFSFMMSTVHIYYGSDSGQKYRRRVGEIKAVAEFLARRSRKNDQNHVLVGDFNILSNESDGSNALEDAGFKVFQNREGSNKDQSKFYDQISFMVKPGELQPVETSTGKGVLQFFESIYREEDFDAYRPLLMKAILAKIEELEEKIEDLEGKARNARRAETRNKYLEKIKTYNQDIEEWQACLANDAKLKSYYLKTWRTFHGSDHLPLWVELEIDFSGDYLDGL